MKTLTRLHVFTLTLIVTLMCAILLMHIAASDHLIDKDAQQQLYLSRYAGIETMFGTGVEIYNGYFNVPHPSILQTQLDLIVQASEISLDTVYRFGALVLRGCYILLVFGLAVTLTNDRRIALVTCLMAISSQYFVHQSYILFPENVAVIFFLFLLWALERYRQSHHTPYLFGVFFALVGGLYVHPLSTFIAVLILIAYVIYFLVHLDWRSIEQTLLTLLFVCVVAFPIIIRTFSTVIAFVTIQQPPVPTDAGFALRLLLDYIVFIGLPFTLFLLPGLVYLGRWRWKANIHVLVFTIPTIFLAIGTYAQVFVPITQLRAYLLLPLVMVGSLYVKHLFKRMPQVGIFFVLIFVTAFAVDTLVRVPETTSITAEERNLTRTINSYLAEFPDRYLILDSEDTDLIYLIEHPQQVCAYENVTPKPDTDYVCADPDLVIVHEDTTFAGYVLVSRYGDRYLLERVREDE